MADGASGGLTGVLFEAGKAISDAGKQQAKQSAQTVFSSVTGSQKPLFSKPQTSAKPTPQGSQMPKLDSFGDLGALGKLFEGGKGTGTQSSAASQNAMSQQQLQTMAAQNEQKDQAEIARVEAELAQLRKQLHDENYYNAIKNAGKTMAEERQERSQQAQQEEAEKQQQMQTQGLDVLPGSPLSGSQQLGDPISVQQAKTQTEINRGTTG